MTMIIPNHLDENKIKAAQHLDGVKGGIGNNRGGESQHHHAKTTEKTREGLKGNMGRNIGE